MKKKKVSTWEKGLISGVLLMIVIGMGLIFHTPLEDTVLQIQVSVARAFNNGTKSGINAGTLTVHAAPVKSNESWYKKQAEVSILSAQDYLQANTEANRKRVFEDSLIGSLYIPSIATKVPVLRNATKQNLMVGAGTLNPDQVMGKGNYALAAHDMEIEGFLFSSLYRLQIGATIYLTDLKNIYEYKVTMNRGDFDKTDKAAAEKYLSVAGDDLITMTTCSYHGARRRVVQGKLVNKSSYYSADSQLRNSFSVSLPKNTQIVTLYE